MVVYGRICRPSIIGGRKLNVGDGFSILVQGGQWVQIQDSPNGKDYLDMSFESRERCTDAALARELKLLEAGVIAQFKCLRREAQKLE